MSDTVIQEPLKARNWLQEKKIEIRGGSGVDTTGTVTVTVSNLEDYAQERFLSVEKDFIHIRSARSRVETLETLLSQTIAKFKDMETDRDSWQRESRMYSHAWQRELGGVLIAKSHLIDALVLTTQRMKRLANLQEAFQKQPKDALLCDHCGTELQRTENNHVKACTVCHKERDAYLEVLKKEIRRSRGTYDHYTYGGWYRGTPVPPAFDGSRI